MGQNFPRNDTSDETARYLHDGSVMGAWQAQLYDPLRSFRCYGQPIPWSRGRRHERRPSLAQARSGTRGGLSLLSRAARVSGRNPRDTSRPRTPQSVRSYAVESNSQGTEQDRLRCFRTGWKRPRHR
jgi:hypothetical protein